MTRSLPLAAAFLACSLAVPARAADPLAPEPGVWWEITSQMTLRGKSLPPEVQGKPQTSTNKTCLPKKIPDRPPPELEEGDCTISDYKRSGSRITFKLACKGAVTGEADLVMTSETYSGTTVMHGPGLENRITLKGKKLGGDCDANAELRERQAARQAVREAAKQAKDAGEPDEPADEPEADGKR